MRTTTLTPDLPYEMDSHFPDVRARQWDSWPKGSHHA
jgi:hypothetical protein